MLHADGLLLFQGSTSNPAIPGKLYEYIRARRPIFAMVDPQGETAAALKSAGIGMLVPLNEPDAIADGLLKFLQQIQECCALTATAGEAREHSREFRTQELADLFDAVTR
jgi:hypothetical protein